MHKTGKTVLITVIVLSALILVCVLLSMRRVETFEDKYAGADLTTDVAGMERTGTYTGYLTAHADAARPQQVIDVDIAGFEAEGDVHMVDELDGETGVVYTDTASVATWTVDVPEAGMYRLHIRYYLPESRGVAAERSVSINGEIPFERANNICFSRVWTDGGPVRTDNRGNEIRPSQVEVFEWQDADFKDDMGYVIDPYLFYFEQGTNTITLSAENEPMVIASLSLEGTASLPTYEEYLASQPATEGSETAKKFSSIARNPASVRNPLCMPNMTVPARPRCPTASRTRFSITWAETPGAAPVSGSSGISTFPRTVITTS